MNRTYFAFLMPKNIIFTPQYLIDVFANRSIGPAFRNRRGGRAVDCGSLENC